MTTTQEETVSRYLTLASAPQARTAGVVMEPWSAHSWVTPPTGAEFLRPNEGTKSQLGLDLLATTIVPAIAAQLVRTLALVIESASTQLEALTRATASEGLLWIVGKFGAPVDVTPLLISPRPLFEQSEWRVFDEHLWTLVDRDPLARHNTGPLAVHRDTNGEISIRRGLAAVDELSGRLDLPIADVMNLSGMSESAYYYWRNNPNGYLRRGKSLRLFRIRAAMTQVVAAIGEGRVSEWFSAGSPSPRAILTADADLGDERGLAELEERAMDLYRSVHPALAQRPTGATPRPLTANELDALLAEVADSEAALLDEDASAARAEPAPGTSAEPNGR
jgi:hypothetical protein